MALRSDSEYRRGFETTSLRMRASLALLGCPRRPGLPKGCFAQACLRKRRGVAEEGGGARLPGKRRVSRGAGKKLGNDERRGGAMAVQGAVPLGRTSCTCAVRAVAL